MGKIEKWEIKKDPVTEEELDEIYKVWLESDGKITQCDLARKFNRSFRVINKLIVSTDWKEMRKVEQLINRTGEIDWLNLRRVAIKNMLKRAMGKKPFKDDWNVTRLILSGKLKKEIEGGEVVEGGDSVVAEEIADALSE